MVKEYYSDATTAVKSIIRNAKGSLPKNMEEASKAVYDTKLQTWQKIENLSTEATKQGVNVDLSVAIKEMRTIANSPTLRRVNMAESERLLSMADEWELLGTKVTPSEAENLLSMLNNASKTWWKNPTPADTHSAINYVRTANNVRKALFDSIPEGKAYASLRNEYGSLSAVEKDITHRATVFGRRNPKGFFDLADIYATGRFIHGLAKVDPTMMVASAAEKGMVGLAKLKNNPDRIIRKMFNKVEKQMVKQGEISPRVSRSGAYLDEPAENFIGKNLRPEEGVYRYRPQPQTYKSQPPSVKKGINIVPRKEPKLSNEIRTIPKPTGRKPRITADTIKSMEIVNRFRKKEGLPPISKFDYNKQREFEIQEALKKINEFRAKKGLPLIKID